MKLTKLTIAAAALATAAILTTSARAQVYPTVNSGDLLIGFEQQGNASDYVVDLGSASQFIGDKTALNFQLSTADLSSVFSSSWASNSNANTNVQWGVAGNDQSDSIASDPDGSSIWFTKGELTSGTQTTAPIRGSSSSLNQVSNKINALDLSVENLPATTNTQNQSSLLGVIQTASAAGSWSSGKPGTYSGDTSFGLGFSIEQAATGSATGPTDSVLDLYEDDTKTASNQPATFLGTFSLSSGGDLSFDPAAVPEPSAYALGLTALVLFTVLKRRKSILAQGQA